MLNQRSLSEITREIKKDWVKPNFAAVPYIEAMSCLDKVTDNYGMDNGKYIVNYFLCNAGTWRGETAKRIKAELKQMAK
jgi:hypothetical protein